MLPNGNIQEKPSPVSSTGRRVFKARWLALPYCRWSPLQPVRDLCRHVIGGTVEGIPRAAGFDGPGRHPRLEAAAAHRAVLFTRDGCVVDDDGAGAPFLDVKAQKLAGQNRCCARIELTRVEHRAPVPGADRFGEESLEQAGRGLRPDGVLDEGNCCIALRNGDTRRRDRLRRERYGHRKRVACLHQNAVIGALTSHAADIAEAQPEKLAKLRGDIELVTLEALITRYEGMLGENLAEGRWQAFFNENPFILNMAFGYPVIKVRDQASVGGRKLSGDGEKITDFLVKNSLTNNTAIFEIKTPQTPILNKTPFRDGVYTPSADLSGSINQALDQKYQFQKQIAQIKDNTRLYDIESYAVHCCLVIGKTPEGDDRKKSFELFRRNSKDVEIVTFDELLEKLKQLSAFLRAAEAES